MEVADGGVRTSKGCRKYGITELRNLAASSGMTDLWKNGITEAASRGNTEAQSAEMRIRGKPKNRIHGYFNPCKTVDDGRGEERCSGFGVEL